MGRVLEPVVYGKRGSASLFGGPVPWPPLGSGAKPLVRGSDGEAP